MKVFPGLGMADLTNKICESLLVKPGQIEYKRFSDGEIRPQIQENVRGKRVFLVQSMNSSDSIIALLLTLDAFVRAHACPVAVLSYFGYGRQERKDRPRVPISAEVIAKCIDKAGAKSVLCVDLHALAIEGFFRECDHIFGSFVLIPALKKLIEDFEFDKSKLVVVAPDKGRVEFNHFYAQALGIDRVFMCRKRTIADNQKEVIFNEGPLPQDAIVLLCDDMLDTAGTITRAAKAVNQAHFSTYRYGCQKIIVSATHAVLSGNAIKLIDDSPIDQVLVTDTIPVPLCSPKMKIISIAPVIAEAIKRIHLEQSVSEMFRHNIGM